MVFDAEFDRPVTPKLARDLYWMFQAFTALLAGFAAMAFLIGAANPVVALSGFFLAPVAWLLATIAARMWIELALVIFDLHNRITRVPEIPNSPAPGVPTPPTSPGKAIERWTPNDSWT